MSDIGRFHLYVVSLKRFCQSIAPEQVAMINNRFVIFFKEKEVDAQKIDCMVNSAQRRISNVMENLEADGVIK